MRLRPRLPIVLLIGAVALAACTTTPPASPTDTGQPSASSSPMGELRPIRLLLSYRPDVQFAPFYVAQQEGYFERAGSTSPLSTRTAATSSDSSRTARPTSEWPMPPT